MSGNVSIFGTIQEVINSISNKSFDIIDNLDNIISQFSGQIDKVIVVLLVTVGLFYVFKIFAWDMIIQKKESVVEEFLSLLYQRGVPFIIAACVLLPLPGMNEGLLKYAFSTLRKSSFDFAESIFGGKYLAIPLSLMEKIKTPGGQTLANFVKDPIRNGGFSKLEEQVERSTDDPFYYEYEEGGSSGDFSLFNLSLSKFLEGLKNMLWELVKAILIFVGWILFTGLFKIILWLLENAILALGFLVVYFYFLVESFIVMAKMVIYYLLAPLTVVGLFFDRFSHYFWDIWRKYIVLFLVPVILALAIALSLQILGIYYYVVLSIIDKASSYSGVGNTIKDIGFVALLALIVFLMKYLVSGSQLIVSQTVQHVMNGLRSVLGSE